MTNNVVNYMKTVLLTAPFLLPLVGCQYLQSSSRPASPVSEIKSEVKSESSAGQIKGFSAPAAAFDGSNERFQSHDTYMAMSLPSAPYVSLFAQLGKSEAGSGGALQNRGEAHVTVLTPQEFALLKTRLSADDIVAAAEKLDIQQTEIKPICVGEGVAKVENAAEKTFFVVISAPNLVRIRRELQRMFVSYGGDKKQFEPEHFHPHITLGFTRIDLHEEQGVIKDVNSCKFSIVVLGGPRP